MEDLKKKERERKIEKLIRKTRRKTKTGKAIEDLKKKRKEDRDKVKEINN